MKNKHLLLIFVLFLSVCLLSGCVSVPMQTVQKDGITLTLGSDFTDVSQDAYAAGMDFLFNGETMAVGGIREKKADFQEKFPGLTLEQYAALAVSLLKLEGEPKPWARGYSLTYTAETTGQEYTYLVAFMESNDSFWMLQAYCPTSFYPKNEEIMWDIFSSAAFD